MAFRKLPSIARTYILANIGLGLLLIGTSLQVAHLDLDLNLGFLLAFAVLTNIFKVTLTVKDGKMTLSNMVVFLAIMLRLPLEAVVVAAVSAFAGTVFIKTPRQADGTARRRVWYKPALSISNLTISGWVSAYLWHSVWHPGLFHSAIFAKDHWDGSLTPQFMFGLFFMTGSYFVVNTTGIAAAMAFSANMKVTQVWKDNFLWTFPGFLCGVSAAAGAAILFYKLKSGIGPGVLLLIPPSYVVYYSYKLYLDKIDTERRQLQHLNELNSRVISTLAMTIEAKDRYTHKHVERVREYALAMAEELTVTSDELKAIRIGSMVHDIGKIAVPEMILTKPGKLTNEEHERMQGHVAVGVKILDAVNFPFPVTDAVAGHHEKWDGTGYPRALRGEEIPLVGRVVALADGYDAITSDRPYRKGMTKEDALELIVSERGKAYDPNVVDALIRSLPKVQPIIDELNRHEFRADEVEGKNRMNPHEAFTEIAQAAEEAVALTEISLKPNVSHNPQEVIDLLLEKVRQLLPSTTAALYLLDDDAQEIRMEGCLGMYQHLFEGLTIKVGEGVSGWVVAHSRPAKNSPATGDVARRVEPGQNLELNSTLSVPLLAGGACMGTITLYHTGYNIYNDHHQRLLLTLAEHAASALDTLFRLQTNHVLAYTDSLTGLPNMRSLIQHLEKLTAQKDQRFSILLLDLNGFKQINDTWGHLEGDKVLREVSKILRNSTRIEDLVGRYAGDEFVIVCPETQFEDATQIADRIKQDFVDYSRMNETEYALSTSVGVARFPADGNDWRSLVSAADRRMYRDKMNSQSLAGSDKLKDILPMHLVQ